MAGVVRSSSPRSTQAREIPPLVTGDHLSRAEFERRYSAMPNLKKAELVERVVFISPTVTNDHGEANSDLIAVLGTYEIHTPGLSGGTHGPVRLDFDNEFQPDGLLRILEDCGGQSHRDDEGYISGAPELVAEVAVSSVSIDLHAKLHVYRRHGVREYVVWRVADGELDWFVLRDGVFERLAPTDGGVYKSEILPGLWLDAPALLRGDGKQVLAVLHKGLASKAHGEFVKELARRKRA